MDLNRLGALRSAAHHRFARPTGFGHSAPTLGITLHRPDEPSLSSQVQKPPPPRPSEDFRITTFAWQVDNEANHAQAGFPKVSHEVLQRRFFQLLSFLQAKGMTVQLIVREVNDIDAATELRSSDLTEAGYRFAQRYADRWVARMHKDKGASMEQALLEKWHAQFVAEASDA